MAILETVHYHTKGFPMYYNKVEICGVNTAKLPTLTSKEKKELLLRTKEGDVMAREQLIHGNLRLVLSIIQRFTNRKENMDDLFQVGCIGLIKAVDNFNTDIDVELSTYAVPMIIGEIKRYLRDNNAIRVSRSIRDLAYRALQTKEQLAAESNEELKGDKVKLADIFRNFFDFVIFFSYFFKFGRKEFVFSF